MEERIIMDRDLIRGTRVEINLDNIEFNIKEIRKLIGGNVSIAAVLKANAYGHGAVEIVKTVIDSGADVIAVATLSEALELRNNFNNIELLIMGHTPNRQLKFVIDNNIIQTVFSYNQAKILSEYARETKKEARVHIKYDTGFNRLGFRDCDDSIEEIIKINELPSIKIEGIFSHLALKNYIEDKKQFDKFTKVIEKLKSKGLKFKYDHICDSISGVDYPDFRLNMIRPGAIIYGLKSYKNKEFILKQALTFKSEISYIKEIKKGESVGYDFSWTADRDSIIGTLPFGYADGYPRNMTKKGEVTIRGVKAPIIGKVCMDQCMVDLTDIPSALEGDVVIVYFDGSNNTVSIQEMSELAETNKNEIVGRISRRVPRVYIKDGEIVKVKEYLLD